MFMPQSHWNLLNYLVGSENFAYTWTLGLNLDSDALMQYEVPLGVGGIVYTEVNVDKKY